MLSSTVLLSVGIALTACDAGVDVPDMAEVVPIVDSSGRTVGTADSDDLNRAIEGGEPAEVRSDGELVGHFGEQFTPLEVVSP